jgi:formate--tetrahydrofolate ligase
MKLLYPDDMPLYDKIRTIAREIYRAADISAPKPVRDQLASFEAMGLRQGAGLHRQDAVQLLDQPRPQGAPEGHTVAVREVRLSAGREFVVAVCGDIMTMPGLPRVPAADNIDLNAEGKIVGLF